MTTSDMTIAQDARPTFFRRALQRARSKTRFGRDESGVTSIEFALLSFPFLVLLFMILELAVVFYISAALDHAASQATRKVRTGQYQIASNDSATQQQAFLDEVCDRLAAFKDCDERVRVDLVRSSSGRFQPGMLPASPRSGGSATSGGGSGPAPSGGGGGGSGGVSSTPASSFVATCPGDVVMVRTEYYHGLTIPGKITFLSNAPDNHRVLTAVTAFRNEPFPVQAGATCGGSGGSSGGSGSGGG